MYGLASFSRSMNNTQLKQKSTTSTNVVPCRLSRSAATHRALIVSGWVCTGSKKGCKRPSINQQNFQKHDGKEGRSKTADALTAELDLTAVPPPTSRSRPSEAMHRANVAGSLSRSMSTPCSSCAKQKQSSERTRRSVDCSSSAHGREPVIIEQYESRAHISDWLCKLRVSSPAPPG